MSVFYMFLLSPKNMLFSLSFSFSLSYAWLQTHTMQGSGDGAMRGIIPRAIQQVGMYKLQLEEKGWEYSMEVSFIEIYNETIRVLYVTEKLALPIYYCEGCVIYCDY